MADVNKNSHFKRLVKTKFLILLVGLLSACNNDIKTNSVLDASSLDARPVQIKALPLHLVQPGETLFSIARQHNLKWQDLAAFNRIEEPYIIFIGQTLQIAANSKPYQAKKSPQVTITHKESPNVVKRKPSSNVGSNKSKAHEQTVSELKDYDFKTSFPTNTNCKGKWVWPAQGTVVGRFLTTGQNINKGIDISNMAGTPIVAAADGLVSYAGTGVTGYGQALVIKHNDVCASFYGHNSKLLVKDLDKVKAGQIIAEMGNTGTDQVKLHFEIHDKNNAIDPLFYLPKK